MNKEMDITVQNNVLIYEVTMKWTDDTNNKWRAR